jgi:hypothetical protein
MRTTIPLSKNKLVFSLFGSVAFFIMGFYLIKNDGDYWIANGLFPKSLGIVCAVFFTATALIALFKLFDKSPGIIIDEKGITDNASGVSAGLIEWKDIKGIRTRRVQFTNFLMIDTSDPEKYLKRLPAVKAWIMRLNMKMYGTPITYKQDRFGW